MKKLIVISIIGLIIWSLIPNQVKENRIEVARCTISSEICD